MESKGKNFIQKRSFGFQPQVDKVMSRNLNSCVNVRQLTIGTILAEVLKLADRHASGACALTSVRVQIPLSAQKYYIFGLNCIVHFLAPIARGWKSVPLIIHRVKYRNFAESTISFNSSVYFIPAIPAEYGKYDVFDTSGGINPGGELTSNT